MFYNILKKKPLKVLLLKDKILLSVIADEKPDFFSKQYKSNIIIVVKFVTKIEFRNNMIALGGYIILVSWANECRNDR